MSESYPGSADLIPIEPNRRLLKAPSVKMHEFYSVELGSRIISMPAGGDEARSHEELVELRLPVFSGIYRNDELWLTVPEGSRPMGKILRFIARDIGNYAEIFYKLGCVYRDLEAASLGFPQATEERSVLDSFVFTVDENEIYGGNVLLVPPYMLNPDKTVGQALGSVAIELEKSELFTDSERFHLIGVTGEGFTHG